MSLLLDLLLVLVALGVASSLHAGFASIALGLTVPAVVTWLVTAMALRHYDPWASERGAADDAAMTSVLVFAVTTVLAIAGIVVRLEGLPNVGVFLLILWPLALGTRFSVFRAFSAQSGPIDDVLIVGVGALGRATADELKAKRRLRVIGFVRYGAETAPAQLKGQTLGTTADLDMLLRTMPIAEVYFASNAVTNAPETQQAIKVCEQFGIPFALPASMYRLDRARPLGSHGVTDGYLHYQTVASRPVAMAFKRAFDILASGVALWVLAPLLLGVAALIKLTSKGDVLFRQTRVGLHGRPFRMLKFRTMVVNAEELKAKLAAQNEMDGPVFKMKHDPRITPIGRFLRKFSIDELPQLINVLRGDMSVVGPRPPVPQEVAKYQSWQRRRLSVRPGLTCIWQVSGRNAISFEEWMYMDLQYIDTWSFSKDLSLILKTFPVVLTGKGAS
ncbi:MAG: sugar transferase [Myxococcaceae bacterium]|nr:sugar transferase [Myxococcaceae bacterium]